MKVPSYCYYKNHKFASDIWPTFPLSKQLHENIEELTKSKLDYC